MARDIKSLFEWQDKVNRKLSRIFSGAFLENSSITNGRMRFIGGLLRIDSGGRVEIVGTLQIDGTTNVTGTFNLDGPWNLKGNGNITGNVTVTGDINVTGTGRIKVGNMVLDPSSNGGSVKFSGGPEVYASGQTLSLYSGALNGGSVDLSPGLAKVSGGGARWLEVNSTGFRMVGLPTIARSSANNAVVGTLWADSAGTIYLVV